MIKIQRILVPVDFSENSLKAVRYGVEIAGDKGSKLYFLHVINQGIIDSVQELSSKGYKGDFVEAVKNLMHRRHDELQQFVPLDWRRDLELEFDVRKGKPASEIIEYSREKAVDLIIVGTTGRSALAAALVGSVARNVMNHARCPVLVVRSVEHDFVE